MPLWGANTDANNAPLYQILATNSANGETMISNTTPDAFIVGEAVGVFAVNTSHASVNAYGQPGWVVVTVGSGGVGSATVNAAGSGFSNGETVNVSNGTVNATLTVVANATGNMTSLAVTTSGSGFVNTTQASAAFNREKHLVDIVISVGGTAFLNTDIITVSNATVNATATLATNSTGGITSTTVTANGLWPNTAANTAAVFTIANSTGGATTGSGETLAANLGTSTGGSVVLTLGGRAGRTQSEVLVAMNSIA